MLPLPTSTVVSWGQLWLGKTSIYKNWQSTLGKQHASLPLGATLQSVQDSDADGKRAAVPCGRDARGDATSGGQFIFSLEEEEHEN